MDKFGMSFGGGPSRKDLLETIESQKKQLAQYQSRFKDVVHAYKSLLKEKEALEASLKVLSGSRDEDVNRELRGRPAVSQVTDVTEDGCDVAAAEQRRDGEADSRKVQLQNQLSTLTSALATVTQEKSRMEASFQADKRQLKQEVERLQECLDAAGARQQAEVLALQGQLAESRARVITQQHEREQEQSDQLQQLQELQNILQQERDLRQDAELRLHEADANCPAASHPVDRGAEREALLKRTREERDQLRRKLREAEEKPEAADPRVERLERELRELDECLQDQLRNRNHRVRQEEARAHAAELRVADLEQRVSELSDLLGSCEKARLREQHAAQRLRERLAQLDTENKMLAADRSAAYDSGPDDSHLDVTALKDKLDKVKKLLLAAQRNPPARTQSEPEATRATAQQEELRQLRDELERYKLRGKAAPKNTNFDEGWQARELEEAREQLADLRQKYINLRIESDKAAVAQRHQLQQQQLHTAALLHGQRQEAERRQAAHRDELLHLEAELHKQRERTVALLDDKDRELERLRAAAKPDSLARGASREDSRSEEEEREADAVGRALRRAAPSEPTLLLYAEQLARKEVEAAGLRRQKGLLEDDVRRLRARAAADAQRHDDETDQLRAQLDKLIREQKREGSDVEYLKNVIYKFLTLPDAGGRQQTLNAILAILHFSPQEKHSVLRQQGAPWWSTHKR
ncbi:GRIP and coiled-coil domain-containing protein 1 isoform X2 [Syngnathoides biaculeatus]|uniref:GRIP and coiled-coil domain-containing protein 1 isoform X2 n=1 Tax=Syngnathoides biaculeatus TaxID=300417 RepID=UPI002ADD4E3F|nr:GRIP and coiled-coil domain-containing protein 1 isoform X2 [Syngnathoides biaculeatus]